MQPYALSKFAATANHLKAWHAILCARNVRSQRRPETVKQTLQPSFIYGLSERAIVFQTGPNEQMTNDYTPNAHRGGDRQHHWHDHRMVRFFSVWYRGGAGLSQTVFPQ